MLTKAQPCGRGHVIDLSASPANEDWLRCPTCGDYLETVDARDQSEWLNKIVRSREHDRTTGKLGTRKQSTQHSDERVSRYGLVAEMVCCAILCPWRLREWKDRSEEGAANRGCDLPASWTGLDKHVEVKQTDHRNLGSRCRMPPAKSQPSRKPGRRADRSNVHSLRVRF
jgi:hypothetical protein